MTKKEGEEIMFKFIGITLVTTSILLVGCGKNSEQKELEIRQERAAQKGNGLDNFDSDKPEKTNQQHKTNNGLDSFNPDKKQ
ncbi:TPA: hypothetical protein MW168_001208 [Acinetobacter baumannii]|nr:hypothetical protein [Acinetobacter baumannii]